MTWAVPTPAAKYGGALANGPQPATRDQSGLREVAAPSRAGAAEPFWSPRSPLFWFGAIAGVTFGLMAGSTTVRVGPVRASVSAGAS